MEGWQWFLLGMMTAFMPSAIALALLLARAPTRDDPPVQKD